MTDLRALSPGDLAAFALRRLDEISDDASIRDRVAFAVVAEAGGDVRNEVTVAAIAERVGCTPSEAMAALESIYDENGSRRDR